MQNEKTVKTCINCFFHYLMVNKKPCIKCKGYIHWKACKQFNYRVKVGNVLSQVTYPEFYAKVFAQDLQEKLRDFDILVEAIRCNEKVIVKLVDIKTRLDGRKVMLYEDQNEYKWALFDEAFQACIGDKNFVEFSSESNTIYYGGYKEVTHVNGHRLLDKRIFQELLQGRVYL